MLGLVVIYWMKKYFAPQYIPKKNWMYGDLQRWINERKNYTVDEHHRLTRLELLDRGYERKIIDEWF